MKTSKKTQNICTMQAIVKKLNLMQLRAYLSSLHLPNP